MCYWLLFMFLFNSHFYSNRNINLTSFESTCQTIHCLSSYTLIQLIRILWYKSIYIIGVYRAVWFHFELRIFLWDLKKKSEIEHYSVHILIYWHDGPLSNIISCFLLKTDRKFLCLNTIVCSDINPADSYEVQRIHDRFNMWIWRIIFYFNEFSIATSSFLIDNFFWIR